MKEEEKGEEEEEEEEEEEKNEKYDIISLQKMGKTEEVGQRR